MTLNSYLTNTSFDRYNLPTSRAHRVRDVRAPGSTAKTETRCERLLESLTDTVHWLIHSFIIKTNESLHILRMQKREFRDAWQFEAITSSVDQM